MIPIIIVAAVLLLILLLVFAVRFHVVICFDGSLRVYLRVLLVKINIYPAAKKKKKSGKEKPKTEKSRKEPEKSGKGGIFSGGDTLETLGMIAEWLGRLFETFSRKLSVKVKKFRISVGTEDAADTAVMYGAVTGASSVLFALLQNKAKFYPAKNTEIKADFLSGKTSADIKIDVYINVSGIVAVIRTVPRKLIKQALSNSKPQTETK